MTVCTETLGVSPVIITPDHSNDPQQNLRFHVIMLPLHYFSLLCTSGKVPAASTQHKVLMYQLCRSRDSMHMDGI